MFSPFSSRQLSVLRLAAVAPGLLLSAPAWAGETDVVFDVPRTIECRDVTSPDFAETHPGEKIVEARWLVSVHVSGDSAQVREWSMSIVSPESRLRVADFSPRTMLESEDAEPACVTDTHENARTLGASLGLALPLGDVKASPNLTAGQTGRDVHTETRKKTPAQRAVLVSGTLAAGHGVRFKVRPALAAPLEGSREFVVRFVVPESWQGDWARVTLEETIARPQLFKPVEEQQQVQLDVGLYLVGSQAGRAAAERLANRALGRGTPVKMGGSTSASSSSKPGNKAPGFFSAPKHSPAPAPSPRGLEDARSALAKLAQ